MFKREDSEWSRFSKALSGQPKTEEEEAVTEEDVMPEPAPAPVTRETVSAPTPTPPPAPPRPTTPTFSRPQHVSAQQENDEVETVIGSRSSFEGTLRCESSLRIKGKVQGEIACAKSLVIEESAHVDAKVTAANAIVAGALDGSIICDGRLEILATGKVSGELTAGVLIIQEGAFFEGHLKMKDRSSGSSSGDETGSSRRHGVSASEPVVS